MPSWVGGRDGERAWERAKRIVLKQYPQLKGADAEDAPRAKKDKLYALVTTVYKSICKGADYECAPLQSESMSELLDRLELVCESGLSGVTGDPLVEASAGSLRVGDRVRVATLPRGGSYHSEDLVFAQRRGIVFEVVEIRRDGDVVIEAYVGRVPRSFTVSSGVLKRVK